MALLQLKLKKSVTEARDRLAASLYALNEAVEHMESMSDMVLIRGWLFLYVCSFISIYDD